MDIVFYSIILILLGVFVMIFGRSFFRGAPYAPTAKRAVDLMLELAQVKPHDRTVDIGSGDGRLVIAFAQAGAREAHGIEINRYLVLWSNWQIKKAGLQKTAQVLKKNLWNIDYSEYDVVTLFGIPYIMRELEKKLLRELKPGSRVILNKFEFPNWKSVVSKNGIHLYIRS